MKLFNRIIEYLNRMKVIDLWGDKMEGMSNKEKEYMDRIPTQNPYGFIGLILGVFCKIKVQKNAKEITQACQSSI